MVTQSNTVYVSEVEAKMSPCAANTVAQSDKDGSEDDGTEGEQQQAEGSASEHVFFDPLLHQPPSSASAAGPWSSPLVIPTTSFTKALLLFKRL